MFSQTENEDFNIVLALQCQPWSGGAACGGQTWRMSDHWSLRNAALYLCTCVLVYSVLAAQTSGHNPLMVHAHLLIDYIHGKMENEK